MIFNAGEEIGSPYGQTIFSREAPGADAVICLEPGRNKNGVLTFRRGLAFGKIIVHVLLHMPDLMAVSAPVQPGGGKSDP